MFQINLSKLTPFDTQVATLANLAPDKWVLGCAPNYVCHHEDFRWFCSSLFGLGAQATQVNTNQSRRLSWRGQILLRRKVREIWHSAASAKFAEAKVVVPHPERDSHHTFAPLWSAKLMQKFFSPSTFGSAVHPPPSYLNTATAAAHTHQQRKQLLNQQLQQVQQANAQDQQALQALPGFQQASALDRRQAMQTLQAMQALSEGFIRPPVPPTAAPLQPGKPSP